MLGLALVFLVLVLFFIRPLLQEQREKKISEDLKQTRSAAEAMAMMDGAIYKNKQESNFWDRLRESYFFWL